MQGFTIYGFTPSGNCQKVKMVADYLGHSYQWVEVDSPAGETRVDEFLSNINPAGQVPAIVFADGTKLAQSNAMMMYLAEGSSLIPKQSFAHAQMLSWLFWEQYSHEPYLAVRRALLKFKGKTEAELDPSLLENGNAALALMQKQLFHTDWLVGDTMSLADICLYAYTSTAEDGGFDLAAFPQISNWLARVKMQLKLG